MTRTTALPGRLIVAFGVVYSVAAAMLFRLQVFAAHPDLLAWGITCDLTITIPLAWYLFVVRPGHARALSLIPLFVVSTAVASRLVPHAQHAFIDQLRFLAAPLDLVTIWLVIRRLARGRSIEEALGHSPLAKAVSLEVATLYYALFCWRKKRADGFTFHERSGWGSIVACFMVVLVAESIGMHLLALHWSAKLAWIVTALDVYGILWIVGDYHAMRLLTTTIDDDAIHFRFGIRWSATIERANIAAIEAPRDERDWKRKDVVKAALLDEPRLLIRLREPVQATGLLGQKRTITALALLPDDLEGFRAALR